MVKVRLIQYATLPAGMVATVVSLDARQAKRPVGTEAAVASLDPRQAKRTVRRSSYETPS